ncbi:MAG: flavodoxin family protein [Deltaproteobacteria bacterium]
MKILVLNASPRVKGTVAALIEEMRASIKAAHSVEVVPVQNLDMRPCTGCMKCRPDKACIRPRDDAHGLAEKVKNADVLIVGAPVYWGNMPGPLKIFFDRNVPLFEYCEAKSIRYIPRPRLKGKRAVIIVSSAAPFPYNLLPSQSKGTIRSLETVLRAGGVKIIGTINIADSYNFEKKKDVYFKKARKIAASL